MQVPNGTGPGVRRSKRPLLASRTRCNVLWQSLHNDYMIYQQLQAYNILVGETKVIRRQRSSPRGNQIWKATFSVCDSKLKFKATRSKIMVWCKMLKVLSQGIHIWNMKALSLMLQSLKFLKSRSNFKVKVPRSKIMVHLYDVKGLVTRKTHVKYESPVSRGS